MWKEIDGYNGCYLISDTGKVKSNSSRLRGALRATNPNKYGYHSVALYKDGIRQRFSIHRLVATYFIPNPLGLTVVNHKDSDKSNNSVNNLEWTTDAENTQHFVLTGNHINAKKTHCIHGHPFDGDNLLLSTYRGKVQRVCRACKREQDKRKRLKIKGEQ